MQVPMRDRKSTALGESGRRREEIWTETDSIQEMLRDCLHLARIRDQQYTGMRWRPGHRDDGAQTPAGWREGGTPDLEPAWPRFRGPKHRFSE